jgi:hypothetical protein
MKNRSYLSQIFKTGMTFALTLASILNIAASWMAVPNLVPAAYYVSTTGSDTNNCSRTAVCKTFNRAMSLAKAGDTIHIMGTIPSVSVTKAGIIIEGGKIDGIANKTADSSALAINASNITVRNVEVVNGWSYGIRTGSGKGDGLVLDNVSIHNNVLENKMGNGCNTATTHGWGSGFRAYYSSNITVKNSRIYENCGEGFSSIMSRNIAGINLEVYDNFSVNIYPDQTQNFTVKDSVISCIKPEYQRATLSRSLLLGAEAYSGVSTNVLDGVTFERNKIYNCRGVGIYSETTGSWKNIRIVNNSFYNVPAPVFAAISGTNIVLNPNTIQANPPTGTATRTNTPVKTPTPIPPTVTKTLVPTNTQVSMATRTSIPATVTKTLPPNTLTLGVTATLIPATMTNTLVSTAIPTSVPSQQSTAEVRVNNGSDDVEESASGWIYLDSTDLELVHDANSQIVGLRFTGVNVPSNAVITYAHIRFTVDETSSETLNLQIRGEATLNAMAFIDESKNVSSRPGTQNFVNWSPAPWVTIGASGAEQLTPNLALVIQEIINQPGWNSGNSLVIMISGTTGRRVAKAFEDDPSGAALLHIEYSSSD